MRPTILLAAAFAIGLSGCSRPTVDCGPFDAQECSILVTAATGAVPDDIDQISLEGGPTPTCPGGNCRYLSGGAILTIGSWFGPDRTVRVDLFGWTPEQVEVKAVTELRN